MDHAPPTKKRKLKQPQSPLACENCRAKKVRCDLTERRIQCSRCENSGVKCNIVPGKRRHLVQRILGSNATNSSPSLSSTTGYGYISSSSGSSGGSTPSTADATSPSSASEGAHSPFSIMSAGSSASSASSFDMSDLEFLSQFDKTSNDVVLPSYIRPLPCHLASSAISGLRHAGCFDLPSSEARTAKVDAYLDWVHPTLPMVDPAQLRALAKPFPDGQPISLLLFKAIELVACVHGSGDIVSANATVDQVHALLKANTEKDPVAVLQSLILMSFSDGDPSGSQDGYYWIGLASTYAARLIKFRPDLSESLRRAVWCLVWRDSVVALASRKPRQVAAKIGLLVSSYAVYDLHADEKAPPGADTPDASETGDSETNTEHWSALHELCGAMQATANLKLDQSESSSASEATRLLKHWYIDWYEPLREDAESPRDIVSNSILLSYWSLAVLNLHCWSPQRSSPSNPVNDYSLVSAALNCITAVSMSIFEQDLIQHIPAAAVAALAPAAVAYLTNSTSLAKDVRSSNSQKYYQCWLILRELRSKYRTAHQAMLMLDALGQRIRQGFDTDEAEHMARLKLWCAGSPVSV